MAKKDVDVRFNLIDNFTASFNKTIGTLTAGTKKAQNAWKSVSKFGDSITGMGTKMSAVVTAPLVGLGAASASEFGNVDKSLRLVQQTMGSTDAQAKTLESAIKSAASNSVFGMQDAAPRFRCGDGGRYDRTGNGSGSRNSHRPGYGYRRRR